MFKAPDGSFSLIPKVYPIVDSDQLDPITFQPIPRPDMEHPIDLGFFVKGYSYKIFWLIPADIHFFGAANGVPVHFLGTDKLGRDILSRGIIGSRISLTIALVVVSITTIVGTSLGITSGYIGGRFDAWLQRFVEVDAGLPAAAALSGADHAHPGDGAVQRLPRLRHRRSGGAWLGAALARGALEDDGAGAHRICACGGGGRRRQTDASSSATSCPTCSAT